MNNQYNIWNKWDPLKTVMLGDCYGADFFRDIKNPRIKSALTRIADETQEDLEYYESVLKNFGCTVLRPKLDANDSILNYINDEGKIQGSQGVPRSPLQPRDVNLVCGTNCLITDFDHISIKNELFKYNKSNSIDLTNHNLFAIPEYKYNEIACIVSGDWPCYADYSSNFNNKEYFKSHVWNELSQLNFREAWCVSSATSFPIGKKLYISDSGVPDHVQNFIKTSKYFTDFELIFHSYDGHVDGNFHPVKPGAILSLYDVQNYNTSFPGWDICYLPDNSWPKIDGFTKIKKQVAGKWWVPGQEENDEFTHFVETWLQDWVGYVEETVFDVNVLVLDEHHVCVNNMNPTVINFLKKHNMEPVHVPWRHRYFWDGGLHCITLDLYREGKQQDYFPDRKSTITDCGFD